MEWQEILLQWDNAQAPILAASLAALSLTAASFLFSIESRLSSELKGSLEASLTVKDSILKSRYLEISETRDASINKIKMSIESLVNAFYWFIATLVYSIGIDPIINKDLLESGLSSLVTIAGEAGSIMPWLSADVGIFTTLFACGLLSLLRAGRVIKEVATES